VHFVLQEEQVVHFVLQEEQVCESQSQWGYCWLCLSTGFFFTLLLSPFFFLLLVRMGYVQFRGGDNNSDGASDTNLKIIRRIFSLSWFYMLAG
jgi:hypothetical protein